jgi:hypothetical protein
MISVERFIQIIDELLLNKFLLHSFQFYPHFSTQIQNLRLTIETYNRHLGRCIWWHEEPLNSIDLDDLQWVYVPRPNKYSFHNPTFSTEIDFSFPEVFPVGESSMFCFFHDINFQLFANSEKSDLKKQWLKQYPLLDWYFFFHGFAALDWFRDFKYLNNSTAKFTKVFICLNHNIKNNRSYRIHLLSELRSRQVESAGFISAPMLSQKVIKQELMDPNSRLSLDAKKHIYSNLLPTAESIELEQVNYNDASANISPFLPQALWSIVTETVYYDEKLHLTEKIFKPIVSQRPFILVAAPGNLAYLKSYGFKTFDRWIDESYDDEHDPDRRMQKISAEIEKLCRLPWHELMAMYQEMQDILAYNYQHFYGDFRTIIVNELVDNFEVCTKIYNLNKSERFRLPVENINFEQVKKVLLQ